MDNNPIEALINEDPHEFKERISDILLDKLSDRLELAKMDVAAQFFGQVAEEEEEVEDEEEEAEDE